MKTQIFAVIFGLTLLLTNVSFAQISSNYKQQFHKPETSQVCSNFSTSETGNQNYKHVANAGSSEAFTSSIAAKCCDNKACAKSECCKNNSCTKDCCHKNQVSNYKHLNPAISKSSCEKSASCAKHKDSCCN